MNDRQNTINGWVLFAGVVALGASVFTGQIFAGHRPDTMGYPIEGVELEGDGGAEAIEPIEARLQTADITAGEQVFKKCAACHTIDKGGANGLGPNLWGTMGKPHGHVAGFAYSDALKSIAGPWDWKAMDEWLASPKAYAPGTKMTFAGLSNPQERANLIAFLNVKSDSPLPMPAAPAADPAQDAAEAEGDGAEKAEDEPVLNEQQAAEGGPKNIGGEGASRLTGPDPTVNTN